MLERWAFLWSNFDFNLKTFATLKKQRILHFCQIYISDTFWFTQIFNYFILNCNIRPTELITWSRLQLKCDGTRWRTGGEVKGKLANGARSQYFSHYLGTWCIQHYNRWCRTLRLPVVDWTDAPADLNGLVRFAERRNLVSSRVPSHFIRSLERKWFTENIIRPFICCY